MNRSRTGTDAWDVPGASVLLLAPSQGLGGGIERYVSTVEAVFQQQGVPYRRMNLLGADRVHGLATKARFVREVRRAVRASRRPVRLVIAHVNLLPVVAMVASLPGFAGATVMLHGHEIWSGRRNLGWRALRRRDVRVVAVSNFSAGALFGTCHASVLNPGLAATWYAMLTEAADRQSSNADGLQIVTAFRLSDWRNKGLGTLMDAIGLMADDRVRLTICGTGPLAPDLAELIKPHSWCRVAANLTDAQLANQLACADLFVLATRTRRGVDPSGEGFGLVLLEAQVAGTAIVAPAHGGSGDAYLPGVTGLSPLDESPGSLAQILRELLADPDRISQMGRAAAAWSRARFEPAGYGAQVIRVLLGPDHDHATGHGRVKAAFADVVDGRAGNYPD